MADLDSELQKLGATPISPELQQSLEEMGALPVESGPSKKGLPAPARIPGGLETLLRETEQGLTFNFGDEINAALEASLPGQEGDWLDRYRKARDESRALFHAGEQAHPKTALVGNLAGALIPAFLSGGTSAAASGTVGATKLIGTQAIKEAAKTGLKTGAAYGAVSGMGGSEADLTQGDVAGAAKDTATGGLVGAALGGAVGAAAGKYGPELEAYLAKLGKGAKQGALVATDMGPIKTTGQSFAQGIKGVRLIGEDAKKALNTQAIEEGERLSDVVQKLLNEHGNEKNDLLINSTKSVDMSKWLTDVYDLIDKAKKAYPFKDDLSEITKVEQIIQDAIEAHGPKFSAMDAEILLRKLGELGSRGDETLKSNAAKAVVHRIISPLSRDPNRVELAMGINPGMPVLGDMIETAVPGIKNVNAAISPLKKAQELVPDASTIAKASKSHNSGAEAAAAIDDFLGNLPTNLAEQEGKKLGQLSQSMKIAEKIAAPGLSHGFFADTSRGLLYGGSNLLGLGLRSMFDMSPEMIQKLAGHLGNGATAAHKQLGKVLGEASTKDRIGRNALIFAIQQNPAYREILNEVTGNKTDVK